MDWQSMSPYERDVLVHTGVMGRCAHEWITKEDDDFLGSWTAECRLCKEDRAGGSNMLSPTFSPPRYTTDIAAAWEVVEKMRASGWAYSVDDHDSRVGCHCTFRKRDKWFNEAGVWINGSAPTAPEAICLAALRARGVDV